MHSTQVEYVGPALTSEDDAIRQEGVEQLSEVLIVRLHMGH